jgi:polysaccharide biosynthesis protein PslF
MPRSFGFLSTYPPTHCGLATFTQALMRALATPESGDTAGVVQVLDLPPMSTAPEVVGHLHVHSPGGRLAAATALNQFDVAIVQHEYGIYGGLDGDQLLAVLEKVDIPIVTVAHTVLQAPTPHQAQVLRQVVDASDAVVTMSDAACDRLIHRYHVDPHKVRVIRHGASPRLAAEVRAPGDRPLILTWGLLGPGKGIEWAIDGLQRVRDIRPTPAYIVAGQTHPRVRLHDGESYRMKLTERARLTGVSHMLRFARSYLDETSLTRLIGRADVVLLPYDSREQVTSGVLVEAVAAGKPVVATAFPHAAELLAGGAGLLVPQFDAAAIGDALHRVLTEPGLARRMANEAVRLAPSLLWPAVAEQYRCLTTSVLANRMSDLDHLALSTRGPSPETAVYRAAGLSSPRTPCAAAAPAAVALPRRIHSNPTAIVAPRSGPTT